MSLMLTRKQKGGIGLGEANHMNSHCEHFCRLDSDMPGFTALCYTSPHRCCFFHKFKSRLSTSKKMTTHFVLILTYHGGLLQNPQCLWRMPVYGRELEWWQIWLKELIMFSGGCEHWNRTHDKKQTIKKLSNCREHYIVGKNPETWVKTVFLRYSALYSNSVLPN